MISWVYTYAKMYQIIHFKYVQFIVWQLHLNKAVFKSATVMKDKEGLNNCHSLEETKKTWQLNSVWDPCWIPEHNTKKDVSGKTGKIIAVPVLVW